MEFLVDVKVGSFLHKRARARNQAILRFEGLSFRWDGGRHLYSAGFVRDLAPALLNHPALNIAVMSAPSSALLPESEIFKPEPEPKLPPKAKKGKGSPPPPPGGPPPVPPPPPRGA